MLVPPDFDKMLGHDLQVLAPYFKDYGITRTVRNEGGKHKNKTVQMLRAEFKALPESQVQEAWQRYQQALGAQRGSDAAASHADDANTSASAAGEAPKHGSDVTASVADVAETSASSTGDVPKNHDDDMDFEAPSVTDDAIKTSATEASTQNEEVAKRAQVYPKRANGLYDFESMKLTELRSLVTVFKAHDVTYTNKKVLCLLSSRD